VNTGAVLLTYTSTNETLTAAYSTNATPSKLHWVKFASVTLSDLSMSQTNPAADSFLVAISGDASMMKLGMTPAVAAGNFKLWSGATAVSKAVLLPQSINFPTIGNKTYSTNPIRITLPTASSKLQVTTKLLLGPATLSGNLLSFQGTGFVTLSANQAGNDRYASVTTNSYIFVDKGRQSISFPEIATQTYPKPLLDGVNLAAIASSGLPVIYTVISGSAGFLAPSGNQYVYTNSSADIMIHNNVVYLTGTGLVTIEATQEGNTNYYAAPSVIRSFNVKATPSSSSSSSRGGGDMGVISINGTLTY
jgi:hypothetical protein